MGQKVHPHGLRVGIIKDWDSKWFAGKKEFGDQLVEDYNIRKFVKKSCYDAGVSKIVIERKQNKVYITLFASKPGIIIGKGGKSLKKVGSEARYDLEAFFGKKIFLELYVKVEKDWRNKENKLRYFGYKPE